MDTNLIKYNLLQRGLDDYKGGLISLHGRIMGRGKGYTSGGWGGGYHHGIRILYKLEAGDKSTKFTTWKIGGIPGKISVASP